mmetsp:Transcript_116014/g.217200  ORF Transcript_116014/g.217200 Transcript_116014/m.217200 type:complete len:213 (+) Transcript_116014:107-745(+)
MSEVSFEVCRAFELIRKEGPRTSMHLIQLFRSASGHIHVMLRARNAGWSDQFYFRAKAAQQRNFFRGLVIWHYNVTAVTFGSSCQRQRDARTSRRTFHNCSPRTQQALHFSFFHNLTGHAILLTTAWAHELSLCNDPATCCLGKAQELYKRCPAHQSCETCPRLQGKTNASVAWHTCSSALKSELLGKHDRYEAAQKARHEANELRDFSLES